MTSDKLINEVFSFHLGSGGVKLKHNAAGCSIMHYVGHVLLTVSQSSIYGAGTFSC